MDVGSQACQGGPDFWKSRLKSPPNAVRSEGSDLCLFQEFIKFFPLPGCLITSFLLQMPSGSPAASKPTCHLPDSASFCLVVIHVVSCYLGHFICHRCYQQYYLKYFPLL